MNYIDYLRMTRKEDKKETFIDFLINIKDWDRDVAIREAFIYYG